MPELPFLKELADRLAQRDDISNHAIIFPSRRAGFHFRRQLSRSAGTPLLSPDILSLDEFLNRISPWTLIDSVSLALEMYPVYRQYFPEDAFDRYYPWGLMLASDFEEVDRHGADPASLFRNLYDLRDIDVQVGMWGDSDKEPSAVQQDYLKFWESMGKMYHRVRESSLAQNRAWPGLAMRLLSEKAVAGELELPWEKVVFAGFNWLSITEENLIISLVKDGRADVFFDMDIAYTGSAQQEAGQWFRNLKDKWKDRKWEWENDLLRKTGRKIRVTGVPGRVSQAKVAGLRIQEWVTEKGIRPEKIAVVLPEEGLLFPLLNSIPEVAGTVNVTMTFPLRHAPVASLLENLTRMYEHAYGGEKEKGAYYFRDVIRVVMHPVCRIRFQRDTDELVARIHRDNLIWLTPDWFQRNFSSPHLFSLLFPALQSPRDIPGILLEALNLPADDAATTEMDDLTRESLWQAGNVIRRVKEKMDALGEEVTFLTVRRLVLETIRSTGLPFSGEPMQGLQVMGVLETRALDFENLIVLSMNEGVLPAGKSSSSFIPYYIRKGYGLPTFQEKDAIYAYHFFRLLQRARHVELFYNTEADEMGGGELSRFVAQMRNDWFHDLPQEAWKESLVTFEPARRAAPEIRVKKTDAILDMLLTRGMERGFSPSALSSFLQCSLRFYFRYVLNIAEPEQAEEAVEANTFGSITHEVLEVLYTPFVGKTVTSSQVLALREKVHATVDEIFRKVAMTSNIGTGRNYLSVEVIRELVRQVLEHDAENAPFTFVAVEKEFTRSVDVNGHELKLFGKMDRVDASGDVFRILDYKTGKVGALSIPEPQKVLEDPVKHKEAFQVSVYAWMFGKDIPPDAMMQAAVLPLRKMGGGAVPLSKVEGKEKINVFRPEDFDWAAYLLQSILATLLDPEIPFEQTTDTDRCSICAYAGICSRLA